MQQQKRLEITPEKAIEHLDGTAAKYQGTRDDHVVLTASVALLKSVVAEWREMAQAAAMAAEPSAPHSPGNGRQWGQQAKS